MVVDQFNYLDFGNLFINELVGSLYLSLLIGSLIIVYVCLRGNVPSNALVSLLIVWNFGLAGYYYSSLVLMVVGLVVAFIVYGVIAKWINR